MANLRDLRKRRKSAASTKKITRTMELVASAKLKKAQDAAAASRPYAEALRTLVARLVATGGSHPLLKAKRDSSGRVLLLVAASDRGLCGSFNANLAALAVEAAKAHAAAGRAVDVIALGRKGGSTLAFLGFTPKDVRSKLVGATRYADAEAVANEAIAAFLAGAYASVEVVYARFVSAARQVPDRFVLLPAGQDADAGAPVKGDCEYIPDADAVLAGVVPMAVRTALYSALLQTSAAEHAARRVAMKNASDAASDMVRSLNLAYNRGRQGKITQEIAEIVGAVEAMA